MSTSIPTGGFSIAFPKNRELTGGDLLAQSLKHLGVTVAFGVHGGHLDAFLMGCEDNGIRLIDVRHEAVAVNAAEGYSKATGQVGVCFATANSGWGNALPGLASAYADRSPIFCVTSSPPRRDTDANSLQGVHDEVVVSKNLTRYACRVTSPEEIPRLVAHAFRAAKSGGACGPALIDFPIDVLFSPVVPDHIAWGAIAVPLPFPPGPHKDAVLETIKLLKAAKRPVIISGMQASNSRVTAPLLEFVNTTGIPTFHSSEHTSMLPSDHPLQSGLATLMAALGPTNRPRPDLFLLLGQRTGMYTMNRSGKVFPKGSTIIEVDTDGSELGRSLSIDLGIVSDVDQFLLEVNEALAKDPIQKVDSQWATVATGLLRSKAPQEDDPLEINGKAHPYHALKAVFSSVKDGAMVSIDGGECSIWSLAMTEKFTKPAVMTMSTGYLGFLGNGWGYSLGYAIAFPDRQVINIQGDGSAGFHIAELDTYARFNLNILTVICNNACWGMSLNGQDAFYTETEARPASKLSPETNYEVVARGLGCRAARVEKIEDIPAVVNKFTGCSGPACIDLIISSKPTHPGTLAFINKGALNVITVPYYDNIPRPYYK